MCRVYPISNRSGLSSGFSDPRERARCGMAARDIACGEVHVAAHHLEIGVSQDLLERELIAAVAQIVRRERMTKHVRRHAFRDPRKPTGATEPLMHRRRAERL